MPSLAYFGNQRFIDCVRSRLEDEGFAIVEDSHSADCILTFCTNMTTLEELYFGEDGIVESAMPETFVMDVSATTPNFATEMNSVCSVHDLRFASAPFLPKNMVAKDAFERVNLSCHIGAEGKLPKELEDLAKALFGDIVVVPNAAEAQLRCAANTVQTVSNVTSAVEAIELVAGCRRTKSMWDPDSTAPETYAPQGFFVRSAIDDDRYEGDYTVEMLMGALSAAIMSADDAEIILPETESSFQLYELLAVIGGSDLSPAALKIVYDGPESKDAKALGLDWGRASMLYDQDSHEHAHEDDEYDYDDGFDSDDDLSEIEEDLFGNGPYSMN